MAKGVITIEGEDVRLNGHKMSVRQFCETISQNTVTGLDEEPLPDNTKWCVRSGRNTVYVLELQPELRSINWLGKRRTVATPYVVVTSLMQDNRTANITEVFYRNRPLTSIDDELLHCNLLNVANTGSFLAYLCLGNAGLHTLTSRNETCDEIVNSLWGGAFSRSFEKDGGTSWFTEAKTRINDPRVTSIERWEQESLKDPRFVLDVNWIPAHTTPREQVHHYLSYSYTGETPTHSRTIGNLLLQSKLLT